MLENGHVVRMNLVEQAYQRLISLEMPFLICRPNEFCRTGAPPSGELRNAFSRPHPPKLES